MFNATTSFVITYRATYNNNNIIIWIKKNEIFKLSTSLFS